MVKVHIREAKTALLHYTLEPYAGQGAYIEVDENRLQEFLNVDAYWKGHQTLLMNAFTQQVQVQKKEEENADDS